MTLDNLMSIATGETQDKVYQIGQTSEKTGLVKTANGWRKPKAGEENNTRPKKDVAAEQTARNEAMKAAENDSQNAAVFNDLNEKAATEGIEYKIRKSKAGEYYWDKYRDGKHVGGGSARDKTDAINRANKNFEEYIKENKTAASRESKRMEAYKKEGFSNLKKYDNQESAESEMWDYIKGTERTKPDVDTIKLYKAPDGKFKWTDDPEKQKKLEGYGYEETPKSDWIKNQTKDSAPLTRDTKIKLSQIKREPTEDKVYQIGQTSEKTGLVKTANGWRKPKTGEQKSGNNKSTQPTGHGPAGTKNKIEKRTDGAGKQLYAIEGTNFYFNNPAEAESAVVTNSRKGKTYATASKDPAINEIGKQLKFKLDTPYGGKHSMDDFIEKVGENEYAANMWSGGSDTSGTLLSPFSESGDQRNLKIKNENGKWKVTYTDRENKSSDIPVTK